ncbi:MAG: rhodanese-like domain-containing protein [Polyangiaceae bacterium]|nr:rhodanese-like domain-containing protein [Polyangiaceae bacterium]
MDIRPRPERKGPLGFIPGSRMFPSDILLADVAHLAEAYPKDVPMALICQSGRRAAELCPLLRAAGFKHVEPLLGGMLAWSAAGLPVCGLQKPLTVDTPAVESLERFPRILAACYLASTVEHADDPKWDGLDPLELVQKLVQEERRGNARTSGFVLERVIDRLAEVARLRGFPLTLVRENVDRMTLALSRAA